MAPNLPGELGIGRAQRRLRVDPHVPSEVGHDEQQVSELLETMGVILGLSQFVHLLAPSCP